MSATENSRPSHATALRSSLAAVLLSTSSLADPPDLSWRYYRPGNTGIQGDYCEAIWIGADDDPYIAGYQPLWEDGGFAKYVQAEDRWENFSTVDYPEIGDRDLVGAARIHDITEDADGKLWMATWRALLEYDPAIGASSLKRWDGANSPHPGGRTMDVEVAPDGSVWATVFGVSWGTGGLLRFEPTTQSWSFWGYGDTANGWPNLTASCDELAIQPRPHGGYTVWIKADNTGRMITFDSVSQVFTQLPQTGSSGEVTGLAGHDSVDDVGNLWAWRNAPSGGFQSVLEYRQPGGTWVSVSQVGVGGWAFKAFGDSQALGVDGNSFTWRFDGVSWQNLGQWRPGAWTYAADIDSAGNVWVSGTGGAARRDATTGVWQRYRVSNTSMLDYFTRDMSFDAAGGVWMSGNAGPGLGGFQHFDGRRWFNHNDTNYGLGGPWGFPTDNCDAIATRAGGGVVVNPMFNGIHEWTGIQYVDLQGMGSSEGLVEDSLGRVWSVGEYFSLRYHDGSSWISVPIAGWGSNIVRDPEAPGTVWAAANLEVVRTDGSTLFSRQNVDFPELNPMHDVLTSVAAAPGGVAWVGSTEGLFRVDANTGTHQWFHPSNSAIPGDQISPMAVSPDGRVWFTNFGSTWPDRGLGWFDGANFGYFPEGQLPGGLPHAQIADMEVRVTPGGYELWISCTSEGVAVLTVSGLCQPDLGFAGPGAATLSVCGEALTSGASAELAVTGTPAFAPLWIVFGTTNTPTPLFAGTLVPFPPLLVQPLPADGAGAAQLTIPGGAAATVDVFTQGIFIDGSLPGIVGFTNAVAIQLLP